MYKKPPIPSKLPAGEALSNNYAPLVGDNYAPEKIRVIIPVGGKATRLLPLTAEKQAKPAYAY